VNQTHAFAAFRLIEVAGGKKYGNLFFQQLVEYSPEVSPGHGVHTIGWLVEEENLRGVDECAGEAQLLLHSAGEVSGKTFLKGRQPAELKEAFDPRGPLLRWNTIDVGIEVDVFDNGEVFVEAESLGHVSDAFLKCFGLFNDVVFADPGVAGGRFENACE